MTGRRVSVWCAVFADAEALGDYVSTRYTEDGDGIPSRFDRDFALGHYDPDVVESEYFSESTADVDVLVAGFSYAGQFRSQLPVQSSRFNSAILVYDYEYDPPSPSGVAEVRSVDYGISFIGSFTYVA